MECGRRKVVKIHADSFEIHRRRAHCMRAMRQRTRVWSIERSWREILHHKAARPFVGGSGQPLGDPPQLGFFTCRRARNGCHRTLPGKAPAWRRGKNATGLAGQLRPHRGGAKIAPENSLEGFREGLRVGAGVLELDVHATADGTVVVHHDEKVDRTTDGSGAIREMTLAEVKRLDAGYRFTPDGG